MFVAICIIILIFAFILVIRRTYVHPIFAIINSTNHQLSLLSLYMGRRCSWGELPYISDYRECKERYNIVQKAVAEINVTASRISQVFMTSDEKEAYSSFLSQLKTEEDKMNTALRELKKFEASQGS